MGRFRIQSQGHDKQSVCIECATPKQTVVGSIPALCGIPLPPVWVGVNIMGPGETEVMVPLWQSVKILAISLWARQRNSLVYETGVKKPKKQTNKLQLEHLEQHNKLNSQLCETSLLHMVNFTSAFLLYCNVAHSSTSFPFNNC